MRGRHIFFKLLKQDTKIIPKVDTTKSVYVLRTFKIHIKSAKYKATKI